MKNWFIRHKILLITFAITSITLLIMITYQISIIMKPDVLEELNLYIETNEMTSSLKKYAFITLINIVILGMWAILFFIITWQVFFPTRKSMRDAFQIDSFMFLYNMPQRLKKELKRHE